MVGGVGEPVNMQKEGPPSPTAPSFVSGYPFVANVRPTHAAARLKCTAPATATWACVSSSFRTLTHDEVAVPSADVPVSSPLAPWHDAPTVFWAWCWRTSVRNECEVAQECVSTNVPVIHPVHMPLKACRFFCMLKSTLRRDAFGWLAMPST